MRLSFNIKKCCFSHTNTNVFSLCKLGEYQLESDSQSKNTFSFGRTNSKNRAPDTNSVIIFVGVPIRVSNGAFAAAYLQPRTDILEILLLYATPPPLTPQLDSGNTFFTLINTHGKLFCRKKVHKFKGTVQRDGSWYKSGINQ